MGGQNGGGGTADAAFRRHRSGTSSWVVPAQPGPSVLLSSMGEFSRLVRNLEAVFLIDISSHTNPYSVDLDIESGSTLVRRVCEPAPNPLHRCFQEVLHVSFLLRYEFNGY